MSEQKNTDTWLAIISGVLAIFLIKSLFESDDSKIVSKKGRKLLSDENEMKKVNQKIINSEQKNEHQGIVI